jgi:Fe-S-cluster containining protein
VPTYFTFPDGALRYDCPSCGQHCCRGKGFALGASELVPLLGKVPSLAAQLRVRSGGTFLAANLTDACWFLQTDGNCGIETAHGRALKPSTCRLFPFNRVYRVGPVRVVDFNSQLCPLEEAGGAGVRHAELESELDALAAAHPEPPAWQPALLPDDWLAVEEQAAAAARAHAADPDGLARAAGADDTATSAAGWARVYGLTADDARALEAAVAPRVALLAPSLRWNFLFRKDAPPYPQGLARVVLRLRALAFLGTQATRVRGAAPSLRGLTELWIMQAPVLDVLERWQEPVQMLATRFDADIPAPLEPALGVMMGAAFRGKKTLGEVVELTAASLPEPQRPLAVALAAAQLHTMFES